jgi:leucyl aminopeptidase (aminopeptidase T)
MIGVDQLRSAAAAAVECLGISGHDRVAVVSNPPQRRIADALAAEARKRTAQVVSVEYATLTRHGEEPPPDVGRALRDATAALAPTVFSLSHTKARIDATARGVRIASMPELDEAAFAEALAIDYALLKQTAAAVGAALTAAASCRLTSPAGTDLVAGIADRTAHIDDGDLGQPGAFGNLPAGEAYIAPIETTAQGTLVLDAALTGYGPLCEPLSIEVAGGRIVHAAGEAAEWLLTTLDAGGEGGRVLAEIGIGVNPGARATGVGIVDEKALGTAHVAFGTNVSFGGSNEAGVHVDGILRAPSVELDGRAYTAGGPGQEPAAESR